MQEARQLKEQVDAAQHKEAVLKARQKPCLDEAYAVMTSIEGKLVTLQATQQKLQANSSGVVTEQMVEEAKQAAAQCTVEVVAIQLEQGGLRTKISMPLE